VCFGDIFLEDLKRWREEIWQRPDCANFPIWKIDSRELIREFFALALARPSAA